jgi:hypothetical protein
VPGELDAVAGVTWEGVSSRGVQGATVLHCLARLYEMAIQGATKGATKCYTGCYKVLHRVLQSSIQWLVAPNDNKPCAVRVALAADNGHSLAHRPHCSLNNFAILESGDFSTVSIGQINFNLSIAAEANAGSFTGTDCDLLTVKFPIAFPIERGLQVPGDFNPNGPAAGLRRGIVVIAADQLNVVGVGLMLGGRRSVQKKQCGKQSTENSASHKAQHVELYR